VKRTATLALAIAASLGLNAQEKPAPVFKIKVDLVVLSYTVTDSKGHYITGLKPGDFRILEDGIPERSSPSRKARSPSCRC